MVIFILLSFSILILTQTQNANAYDDILMPFERFVYDLDLFIPVVTQEVEFAELTGLTDDQAYEQLKTFYPTLQQRVIEMRTIGAIADDNRLKTKEAADKMCGQGHAYGYLKVNHKVRKILTAVTAKSVTRKSNLQMLADVLAALKDWQQLSKAPCHRVGKKG